MIELPDSLEERLQFCRTLPSIPAVVIEVLNLCERDDIGISDIAKALSRDPALVAKVLRIANSAFYGASSRVTTLDRAIFILGINATLSLALSFTFVSNLNKRHKAGFDYFAYWRRSAITAAAARSLASWTESMRRDELFLGGLLQDIGMLIMNEVLPDIYGALIKSSGFRHERLVELERESLGTDHGIVGSWMLDRWKLPQNLVRFLSISHNPQLPSSTEEESCLSVSLLAGLIAGIWCDSDTADSTVAARHEASLLLGISDEKFESLLREIATILPEITRNLDIDVGGEDQVNRLLDQAREALVVLNIQTQRVVHQMKNRTEKDALTLLFNRRYLEEVLPHLFKDSCQTHQPLSVIFADIDHFKNVNDSYGHKVGDSILISVARIFRSAMRSTDIAVRYGGEEFVCLLPNTSEEGVQMVAERIRKAVAVFPFKGSVEKKISVTVSFGCATFSADSNFKIPEELLDEADRYLYMAKCQGRDKVISSTSISAGDGNDVIKEHRRGSWANI